MGFQFRRRIGGRRLWLNLSNSGISASKYSPGTRVEFRESTTGPVEMATVEYELEPTESHPWGGEFMLKMDDGSSCVAWVDELTHAS